MATPRFTISDWTSLRDFALSLDLPKVEETTSWGEPCLKAHGKLWTWWSPTEKRPVFKVTRDERAFLLDVRGDTFFVTDHYRNHGLVLMRPGAEFDVAWAKRNLMDVWRNQAPKRFLKAWEAERRSLADGK